MEAWTQRWGWPPRSSGSWRRGLKTSCRTSSSLRRTEPAPACRAACVCPRRQPSATGLSLLARSEPRAPEVGTHAGGRTGGERGFYFYNINDQKLPSAVLIHGVVALGTETCTMEPPHRRSPGWQVPVREADLSPDGMLKTSQQSQFQREPGRVARPRVASCLWFVCSCPGSCPRAAALGPVATSRSLEACSS